MCACSHSTSSLNTCRRQRSVEAVQSSGCSTTSASSLRLCSRRSLPASLFSAKRARRAAVSLPRASKPHEQLCEIELNINASTSTSRLPLKDNLIHLDYNSFVAVAADTPLLLMRERKRRLGSILDNDIDLDADKDLTDPLYPH